MFFVITILNKGCKQYIRTAEPSSTWNTLTIIHPPTFYAKSILIYCSCCYLSQWKFEYPFCFNFQLLPKPYLLRYNEFIPLHSIAVIWTNCTQWYRWIVLRKLRILFSKISKVCVNHFVARRNSFENYFQCEPFVITQFSFQFISSNTEIQLLNDINAQLNERYEIKSKFNSLQNELKRMEEFESSRKAKFNKDRKKELIQMEQIGQDLSEEHSRVIHQIEHINWHLSHAHPHEITTPIELPNLPRKICHVDGILSGHGHGHIHGKLHSSNKPSANMVKLPKNHVYYSNIWTRVMNYNLNFQIGLSSN